MPRPDPAGPRPSLSRRSLLQTAAGAGAAGLAVTALGTAATAAPAGTAGTAGAGTAGARTTEATSGPIVVHVRDASTGDIEVFAGTSQTRLRDHALAARIASAIA